MFSAVGIENSILRIGAIILALLAILQFLKVGWRASYRISHIYDDMEQLEGIRKDIETLKRQQFEIKKELESLNRSGEEN